MRLIAAMPLLILVSLMIAVVIEHHVAHRKWLTRGKDKQAIPPLYGRSPMMDALPNLKFINELPADERAKAATEYVKKRLADPNDEWCS